MEVVSSEYITRAILSLVAIIASIGLLVWWIRYKGPKMSFQEGHHIKVISRALLDSKHKLLVVEVGNNRFLVATSPSGVSVNPLSDSDPNPQFGDVYKSQIEA